MSFEKKKAALIKYFRNNGGFPKGYVTIDASYGTIGDVSVNGTYRPPCSERGLGKQGSGKNRYQQRRHILN